MSSARTWWFADDIPLYFDSVESGRRHSIESLAIEESLCAPEAFTGELWINHKLNKLDSGTLWRGKYWKCFVFITDANYHAGQRLWKCRITNVFGSSVFQRYVVKPVVPWDIDGAEDMTLDELRERLGGKDTVTARFSSEGEFSL